MSSIGRPVHIRGTDYDGAPHWSHGGFLVVDRAPLIVVQTFAGTEVLTTRGPWASPYDTRGHYWADRWYNVIRLERPRGRGLHGFYCNVATPAEFDGENLHYCDLQLDVRAVLEGGDLRYDVVDEDEFEEACQRLCYPEHVVTEARAAVTEIVGLIEAGEFPFSV